MKDEWKKYLQSIGFQDPLLKQADLALQFYSNFSGMDIDLIFVSEYRDSEKNRVYESLWVFSEDHAGEASLVGDQGRRDLVRITNNIDLWVVYRTGFEFDDKATDSSRLTVNFTVESSVIQGTMKASGDNCLRLAEVLRKFMIPGLGQNRP